MKRYILIVLSLCCMISASAQKGYKGKAIIKPLTLEQMGDSLHVGVLFDFRDMNVSLQRSIKYIPTVRFEGQIRELPAIEVKGRADYKITERKKTLMSKAQQREFEKSAPYAVVKGYGEATGKIVSYRVKIPFESWMKRAKVEIVEDLCGCGRTENMQTTPLQATLLYEKPNGMRYGKVAPMDESLKTRTITGEAFLDFVVSKIDIRPNYMNNPVELKRITDMVAEAQNDSNLKITSIRVVGFASPEGTYDFNKYLSEHRAKALLNYLAPRFSYPKKMYSVSYGGENWDGLLQSVEASEMANKDRVIEIIKSGAEDRKSLLRNIDAGVTYDYLIENFCPSLRVAKCKIDYEVKNFTLEEALAVYKTKPEDLSVKELYMVAETCDTSEQEAIYQMAAKLNPDNDVANLNAAVVTVRKDLNAAEKYLSAVQVKTAEYYNLMGVLEVERENYSAAEEHFAKAERMGLKDAKENRTIIESFL